MDKVVKITGEISGRLDRILELVDNEPGLGIEAFAKKLGYVNGKKHRLGFVVKNFEFIRIH